MAGEAERHPWPGSRVGTPPPCDDPIDVVSSRSDRSVPFEARMKKGEATRRRIVAQAAGLLNSQGYRSTPVSEIMRVTGLQKGGIYRHFDSRTKLTLEAFEYAVAQRRDRFLRAIAGCATATEALLALLEFFRETVRGEHLEGGCPIMNLATE